MRNLGIVVITSMEQQMNQTYNSPQFKKAFAGYTMVLAVALMGASWIRAENAVENSASFVGTTPAAASQEESAPTF